MILSMMLLANGGTLYMELHSKASGQQVCALKMHRKMATPSFCLTQPGHEVNHEV